MGFTFSFIFIATGVIFFILGNVAFGFAKQQTKLTRKLINGMYEEHIALLKTYRDVLKFAKTVQTPYDLDYKKEPKKPTIQ